MPGSAYYGHEPLNDHDRHLMQGLFGPKVPKPLVLPPGEPVSQSRGMVIGLIFAIIIITTVTGARLLTRILRKGQVFGWDDWIIIPAYLLTITYFSNLLARVHFGCAGKHINYCTYAEIATWAQMGGINQVTFFAAVNLIKISMCLFIRRLTGITSRLWLIVNDCFLGLLIVWFFVSFFVTIFQCRPVTAFFNFSIKVETPTYSCLDTSLISNSFSIINCVTDFCLLVIPTWIILRVQMPWGRKARLMGIFSLGVACCICSAYRSSLGNRNSKDLTWIFIPEVSWTIADIFFSALVVSLPALNALVEIAWRRSFSSLSKRAKLSHSSGSRSGKSWYSSSSARSRRCESCKNCANCGNNSHPSHPSNPNASMKSPKMRPAMPNMRSESLEKGLSGRGGDFGGLGDGKAGKNGVVEEENSTRRYSMEGTDVEMGNIQKGATHAF